METITLKAGNKQVIATRNDAKSKWSARLYVGGGEIATSICGTFKSVKGLTSWANRQFSGLRANGVN